MSDNERAVYLERHREARMRLELAEIAYEARQRAGLTQAELARRANTKQGTISGIENGTQNATIDTLNRIADALGMRVSLTPQ